MRCGIECICIKVLGSSIELVPDWEVATRMAASKGREATVVYIIRYIPACRRSGWYPQSRISTRVGISEASNRI